MRHFVGVLFVFLVLALACGGTPTMEPVPPGTAKTGAPDTRPDRDFECDAEGYEARIADTRFSDDDTPVYTINAVIDFGADETGSTDAAPAIQQALNCADSLWGGIVYLPAGHYRLDSPLVIPGNVTLRGDWKRPTATNKAVAGTVLRIEFGAGAVVGSAITLGRKSTEVGAAIRDLSIYYPEQTLADPGNPISYPYTIEGVGVFSTVRNLTLVNPYRGMLFVPQGESTVKLPTNINVYGAPIFRGLHIHNTTATPRTQNLNLGPEYWADSGLDGVTLADIKLAMRSVDSIGIRSGDGDGGGLYVGIRLSGYDTGWEMYEPQSPRVFDFEITNSRVGIDLRATKAHGWVFTAGRVEAEETAVKMYAGFLNAQFNNVVFASKGTLIAHETGTAGFTKCTFQSWGEGHAIESSGGWLAVAGSEFGQASSHVELGPSVDRAVLYGNTPTGASLKIDNNSSAAADQIVIDTSSTHDFIELDSREFPFHPYRQVPKPPAGTTHVFDVRTHGAKGDGRHDDTGAFQDALDAAGRLSNATSGAVVFVPPGAYRLEGRLTVPQHVELRGVHDAPLNGEDARSILGSFADADQPENPAFITLEPDSGIKGLYFFRPEQSWNAVEGDTTLHPYPPAIRGSDRNWVYNVSLGNMYDGIDFSSGGGHSLDFIFGCSLNHVVELSADGGLSELTNFQVKTAAWKKAGRISLPAWGTSGFGDGAPSSNPESAGLDEMGTGLIMRGNGTFRMMGHFVNRSGDGLYEIHGSPTANFYLCGGEGDGTGYYIHSVDGAAMDVEMVSNSYHTFGEAYTVSKTSSGDTLHVFNTKSYGYAPRSHIFSGRGRIVLQQEYRGASHTTTLRLENKTTGVIEGGFFDSPATHRIRAFGRAQAKICGALTTKSDWPFDPDDEDKITVESVCPNKIVGISGEGGSL